MKLYTITTFGPREWLRHHGYTTEGVLEFRSQAMSVATIQTAVARHFKIPVFEMKSQRRHRPIARPRQVAMWLSKHLTLQSLPEIGRRFGGRDHTTVIHAIKRVDQLRVENPEICASVEILLRELQP